MDKFCCLWCGFVLNRVFVLDKVLKNIASLIAVVVFLVGAFLYNVGKVNFFGFFWVLIFGLLPYLVGYNILFKKYFVEQDDDG